MYIGIFSDIHGNQYALRSFIESLPSLQLDELIFCGDIFGYYYGQIEILETLCRLSKLHWILGNHDQYYIDLIAGRRSVSDLTNHYGSSYRRICGHVSISLVERLQKLFPKKEIMREGYKLCIVHGTPDDPLEGRLYPRDIPAKFLFQETDILIMGHTHFRMCMRQGSTLLINSGSLGQPRDKFPAGIAVLILPEKRVEFINIPYDRSALLSDIKHNDPNNKKLIDILFRSKVYK
jgi:putative phosphoesterase